MDSIALSLGCHTTRFHSMVFVICTFHSILVTIELVRGGWQRGDSPPALLCPPMRHAIE